MKFITFSEKTLLLNSSNVLQLLGSSSFETIPNYHMSLWLSQQEDLYDIVLYQCDINMTFWSRKCIRQADCVLIVAYANESHHVRRFETQLASLPSRARKYLILLHKPQQRRFV